MDSTVVKIFFFFKNMAYKKNANKKKKNANKKKKNRGPKIRHAGFGEGDTGREKLQENRKKKSISKLG